MPYSYDKEANRNAKDSRFAVDDDDYDDYEDDDYGMSTEPTMQYDDEPAEKEVAPPAAAVNVVFVSEQTKKEAAEARKAQAANEAKNAAKNAAYLEECKEWLAERGFLVSDMQPDAVLSLRATIEANAAQYAEEMAAIETLKLSGLRVMLDSRRVHASSADSYVSLEVAWGYPATTPRGISIATRNDRIEAILNHVLHTNEAFRSTGVLTPLVKFAHVLLTGAAWMDAAWASEWEKISGEPAKPLEQQKETLVVSHKVSSIFTKAVSSRMSITVQNQATRPTRALPLSAYSLNGTKYVEEHGVNNDLVIASRNQLVDTLPSINSSMSTLLYYANRPLGAVPALVSRLRSLQQIDFSGCGLSTLPDFSGLGLQKLFLSRNLFDRVPPGILEGRMVSSLRILDMAFNKIEELPAALGSFTNLEIMQFDYNRIRKLCPFTKLQKLEVLELTDNELSKLPKSLGMLPKLWRLKIGANPIVGMPPEVYFQGIEKIKEFLNELSPHNLPIPPATIARDIVAMLGKTTNGADVVVVSATTGLRVPALSYIIEARAPRLLQAPNVTALADDEDGYTHQVLVKDDVNDASLTAFVRLLHGTLTSDQVESSTEIQVQLSVLVAAYGTNALNAYLAEVERGRAVDLDEMFGEELDIVARDVIKAATDDKADSQTFGSRVRFAVGGNAKTFVLHRSIVCQRCEFMHSMLTSGLAEASMDVVPLPDADPDVFEAFVTYLYTDTNHKLTPENVVSLLFLAVEYQCGRLRDMAECMVGFNVEVENVAQVIQLAYFLDSTRLKNACIWFVAANYAAVRKTEGFHQLQDELKVEVANKLHTTTGVADTSSPARSSRR